MTRYASGRYHRASGTRNAFAAWGSELVAAGYPEPVVNSGDREEALQEQIFREAYVPSSDPRDVGPFNDRRYWPGHGYWKRVKGNATIAAPGASNHEKRRASDLAYPYDRDTPAHRHGQVLAKRHNITCEGMGFREWWHWTFWGALGVIDAAAGGASSTPAKPAEPDESEEDEMNKDKYCWYKRADGVLVNAIYNTGSGYFQPFESNDGAYNTRKAQGHDLAGPTFEVSASDFQSIQNSCAAVRTGKG